MAMGLLPQDMFLHQDNMVVTRNKGTPLKVTHRDLKVTHKDPKEVTNRHPKGTNNRGLKGTRKDPKATGLKDTDPKATHNLKVTLKAIPKDHKVTHKDHKDRKAMHNKPIRKRLKAMLKDLKPKLTLKTLKVFLKDLGHKDLQVFLKAHKDLPRLPDLRRDLEN